MGNYLYLCDMKKLTLKQINARLDVYQEVMDHLEETLGEIEDQDEIEQTRVVIDQIKNIYNKLLININFL